MKTADGKDVVVNIARFDKEPYTITQAQKDASASRRKAQRSKRVKKDVKQ